LGGRWGWELARASGSEVGVNGLADEVNDDVSVQVVGIGESDGLVFGGDRTPLASGDHCGPKDESCGG